MNALYGFFHINVLFRSGGTAQLEIETRRACFAPTQFVFVAVHVAHNAIQRAALFLYVGLAEAVVVTQRGVDFFSQMLSQVSAKTNRNIEKKEEISRLAIAKIDFVRKNFLKSKIYLPALNVLMGHLSNSCNIRVYVADIISADTIRWENCTENKPNSINTKIYGNNWEDIEKKSRRKSKERQTFLAAWNVEHAEVSMANVKPSENCQIVERTCSGNSESSTCPNRFVYYGNFGRAHPLDNCEKHVLHRL